MSDQTPDSASEPRERPEAPPAPAQQQSQQRRPNQARPQQQRNPQPQWPDLSVVVPLYNEEESLKELHNQIRGTLGRMNLRYEILFIDDGSTDRSFQVLRELKRLDKHVKIIRLRRNYGKSAALSVGFEKSQGNIVVTLDADLQDDPAEIPSLKKRLDDGLDLVSGWKKKRRDPLSKTIPSRFFNFVTAKLTGIPIHDFNCGLKAYRREVVKLSLIHI